jgi:CRP-like cAMP-binding protein
MAPPNHSNHILSRLSEADYGLLAVNLRAVDLPVRKHLEQASRRVTAVYFPESGFASVVADGGKRPIEVGLIGREGMTGLSVVFGNDHAQYETFMQAGGTGHCIKTKALRDAIDRSPTLLRAILRYASTYLEQTARTAVANGRNKVEERLARRLLLASDRLDNGELPLTHEFLAMMLAVRRPGVTVAIQDLEQRGLISRKRGHIVILDRDGLVKLSNGGYSDADG